MPLPVFPTLQRPAPLAERTLRPWGAIVSIALVLSGCSGSAPPPELEAISPAAGSSLGGGVLTVTGMFLGVPNAQTTKVQVGGVPATSVDVVDGTMLTCVLPPGPPAQLVDVQVETGGGTATLFGAFTYHPLPTISALAPEAGTSLGGTAVTVTGTGFVAHGAAGNAVHFDGIAATNVVVVDDNTITCETPAGAQGESVHVVVSNTNGADTLASGYDYHPRPTVLALAPAAGTSLGSTSITVTGTGFADNGASVNLLTFDGVPATNLVVVDDTTITADTPAGSAGAAVDVALANANGSAVLPGGYAYHPTPTVTAVTPASGTSVGAAAVTLAGTGFAANAAGLPTVTFDGVAATNVVVVNDFTITCEAPAGAPGATVDVVASNANGDGSLPAGYTFHPTPTVTAVSPASGTALGGTAVTLTGTGFTANGAGTNTVTFGGAPATGITVVNDTTITCTAPAGTPGALVDVEVTNVNGEGTLASAFRYHAVPSLGSVSPLSGTPLGGTPVTLTGTGFLVDLAGTNTVTFNGVAATSVTVVNDTTITCTTPVGPDGSAVDVVVTNANGSFTLPNGYIYFTSPVLVSVAPGVGTSLGATSVTLTGAGFLIDGAGPNTVTFGGSSATSVVVVDDNTITCETPTGTPGATVDVSVSNANGTPSLPSAFTYHPTPTVTAVAPAAGTSLGGTAVVVSGTGFLDNSAGSATVRFDSVPATGVSVVDDTTIHCVAPAGAAGAAVEVEVTNDNGSGSLADAYDYFPTPTVTGVTSSSGPMSGGTVVTVTGTGFVANAAGTSTVTFDGSLATVVAVVDDTTITCTTPAGTAGASVEVEVTNDNGSGALLDGFDYHVEPTVTSVSPASGTPLGSTAVTVTGTGFLANDAGANTVTFDGGSATAVTVVNDTTITCETPAGTPDTTVDVVVTNSNGSGTLTGGFRFHANPTVTSLAPASGTALGGTSVTVTGTGFVVDGAAANAVTFDGVDATDIVVVNDTTITCDSPPGTRGLAADIVVTNANGSGTLVAGFTYFSLPTLTAVTPPSGRWQGAESVTLTGTGFSANAAGTNTVTFDGASATSVVLVDDTTITCVTPAGTPGALADVVVSNANGSVTLVDGFRYFSTPTLTAVAPASGTPLGSTSVTLTGTGFSIDSAGTNSVTFDGASATSIVVVNDTTITCETPAGTPGATVDVVVSNANGTATLAGGYRYHATPTVTAVSPTLGSSLGGTSVTVTGTGFSVDGAGTNSVTFGGSTATSIAVVNDTTITCVTPAGTAGAVVDVVVSNANGTATLSSSFTYAEIPTVTSVSPAAGTSLGSTSVTISGTGFSDAAAGTNTVTFDGNPATSVVVVDDTTLTCDTPAGTAGATVDVVVTNTNGSATLVDGYEYHVTPTVTGIAPGSGTALGGTTVTVSGTGFVANDAASNAVTIGGSAATGVVVVNDTTLTCDTPAGTPGAVVDVQVANSNGSGTLASGFRYHANPTLTSVSPATGTSLGGTSVTLTGTGFVVDGAGVNTVTFDGVAATNVSVVNDTTVTCDTPPGTPGASVDVALANANGSATLSGGFDYFDTPSATSVAPSLGTSLGGTSVTLTGTGFSNNDAGTNTVTFAGLAATSIVVVNDTTITCDTPAGTPGAVVDIVVANDNGSGTLSSGFTYYPTPSIGSISPDSGSSLGGTSVTVNGTGFTTNGAGVNTVHFDGVEATGVVVLNDATITCTAPAGTPGAAVDVAVTNDNGTGTLASSFTYFPTPTVTSVAPAAGPASGATSVTLTGTGFLANSAGTNTVSIGGSAATSVIVFSDTSMTCVVPAGVAGTSVDVVVTNANGPGTLSGGFSYHPEPTVTGVVAAAGTSLGGTSVTLSGTGFLANDAGTNSVTFGGTSATAVVVVDDTAITCATPAGTPGATVDVVVTNTNGVGTLASGFGYHATPTVSGVTPAAGPSPGGTSVTITGTGFLVNDAGTNAVTFGGNAATSIVVVDDTTITCDAPAGTGGLSVDVVVSNTNGTGTLVGGYAYHPGPTLTSVAASSGRWQGGESVTLTGTGFAANSAGANSVTFDGVTATSIVVVNDTTITCDTPAGTPGALVDVVVSNANGTATLSSGFRYFTNPTLTSVSSAAGTSLGGTGVTLTGSGFLVDAAGTNSVTFDGAAATNVVVVNDTTITCDTPAGTPGASVDVAVTNSNGTATLADGFAYHSTPAVFSLSPSTGVAAGGTQVTISGTGFVNNTPGTNTVTFGGVDATNVVAIDDNTLTCESPPGAPGASVDVVLTNANGANTVGSGFSYFPAPTLASIAPTSGTPLGGTTVTLTGTGFLDNSAGVNAVTFGGVAATEIVVLSDTSISCQAPPGTPGASVDVELTNANGAGTLAAAFTYNPVPTLSSIAPVAGTSLGSTAVTLTGTGFSANDAGTNTVTFDGAPATSVVVVSDTTITCDTPSGTPGAAVDVVVTNTNGSATLSSGFTYHDLPTLTGVSPGSGTSLGATAVTLTGTGFQDLDPGSHTVTFAGAAATSIVVVNDTTITCDTPAGTAGTLVDVSVTNDNGTALLSSGYRYHAVPTLTSIAPATGSPVGGTSVTLTGIGFQDDSPGTHTVTFGGVAATSIVVVNDTTITCDAPAGTAGSAVDVVLTNDNGTDSLTNAYTFYAEPTLTSISPDHGPETGGAGVTLTGTGFVNNSPGTNVVTIDGLAVANLVVVDDTTITCDTPAGTAGTSVDVVLTNDNGSDTLASAYTFNALPTITGIAPAAGTALGGTAVTITGTGFQANQAGTNTVIIDGVAATSLIVVDDTTITGVTPAGPAGTAVDVVVTNLNGSATLSSGFTYHPAPTLTAVAPAFGPAAGGTSVTLTGTGFVDNSPGTNTVTFDGLPASNVVVTNDTTITCDTAAGTSDTQVDVQVSNDNGVATLSSGFEYNEVPVVSNIPKQWAEDGVAYSYTPGVSDPDASDTLVYSSTGTALPSWVTLNTSTGELSGTPASGDLGLTTGHQITVDDGLDSVASNTFSLEVSGVATHLAFTVAPAASEQQGERWTSFTVRVEDTFGNRVGTWSDSITLALATGTGTLGGTLVRSGNNGIATFDDITYDTAEAITFDLTSPGVTGILGTGITITAGPVTRLAFAVEPSAVEYVDETFSHLVVEVQDAGGSRITSDNTTQVDLALDSGAGTLSGTLSLVVTAGRAVFDDLTYDLAGPIELQATSVPVTTTAISTSTEVRAGPGVGLDTVRASVDSVGAEAGAASAATSISANGRFVAFESAATDLVAGDTNGARDIFLRDRIAGTTTRASIDSLAAESNGASFSPTLSANGRFVAFASDASNLVAGDTNAVRDVFVHDTETGTTTRVSVDSSGTEASGQSLAPTISASGLLVAFESDASNLVAGDTNAARDVFLHNLVTGVTTRVSVDSVAAESNDDSFAATLSADGSTVAFHSAATDLVAGDTNGSLDVFVHEPASGQTSRVSIDSVGAQADGDSSSPALSSDGQIVAFASTATDLVASDGNAAEDVFVHDRGTGQTTRASVAFGGGDANGASTLPSISADGDRVVFQSVATNLVLDDDESFQDVFLRRRASSTTTRLSTVPAGGGANGSSARAAISGDGLHAAFDSAATDVVADDLNGVTDSFFRPVHDEPTVTAVAPSEGSSLGGTAVTLSGTGFSANGAGAPSVFLDGVAATSVVVVNDASITCTTPAGAMGTSVDVVVVNHNGSGTLASGYTYRSGPTVSSVAPGVGPVAGGTGVTITGTGFTSTGFGSNSVTFGGVAATNVVTLGDTSITCDSPVGTAGATVDVAVTNNNGTGTLASSFTYHPAPSVASVAPGSGHADAGDTITVTGTGFLDNGAGTNTVRFDGVAATSVVVVDDTTITCTNPAGTAGTSVDVSVTNSNGPATLTGGFAYNPEPAPTVVTPNAGSPLGGTSVTVTGTGFQNNSIGTTTVTIGGTPATSVVVVDDTSITCTAPAGTPMATVDVVVTNDNGTATLTAAYTLNPQPVLTSLAPTAGTSLGARSVTLTGTGFQNSSIGATGVTFDGAAATNVVVVDDTTVTCDTPAGTANSTVDVVLANGNGTTQLLSAYTYFPKPTLATVSPSTGALTGGTTIALSGTGFTANMAGTNTVTIGGNPATGLTTINNTTITCVTPAGSTSGAADIVISNDNGAVTLVGGFLYSSSPTVTSVAPAAGTSLGGTSVTITGTGFVSNQAGANSVTFDGNPATVVVAVDDTTITCVTPAGAAGAAVDVVVNNANGTGTLIGGFTYHASPTVAAVAPAAGTALGGSAVTISGTGFLNNDAGTNTVTFDGAPATSVAVVDDTTLTCVTPAGTGGASVDVVVTNDNGTATLSSGFDYHPTPTVTDVTPSAGTSLVGTSVTVTGTGFSDNAAGANSVTFGGVDATGIVVVNDTTLTCTTPPGTAGAAVDVSVSNDNGAGTLASGFTYHAAPTVSAVATASGTSLGGTSVTVTGTGFVDNAAGTNALTFDGVTATSIVVVDDTTITCVTPAGPSGSSVDVSVTNDNGTGTLVAGFEYFPTPTVTGVAPSSGTSVGGASVTLTGTGFTDNSAGLNTITFDGAAATSVVVVSDTTLTCETPAGVAGTSVDVAVTNDNGAGTLASGYDYFPTPSIASISPNSGPPLGGTSITISGTGFVANSAGMNQVFVDGVAATDVAVLDDNTLTCDTPAGTPGSNVDVVVTNDNGSTTGAGLYTFNVAPTVTGVSPAAGTPFGATAVTVTGTGFVVSGAGTNAVTFDGAAATSITVVDDSTITCVTPAGPEGTAVDVVVSNSNGSGTLAGGFSYHPAPTVTSVTPASGTSLVGTSVTVNGTGFVDNAPGTNALTFGGVAATSIVVVNDTTITCTTPTGAPGTSVDVVVSNNNGSGTLASGFAYNPQPTVTGVAPSAGSSLGGASVTVSGTGFQDGAPGANSVTFDGVAATSVVVVDDTTLTCDVPAGAAGATVDVQVSNANGTGSLVAGFTFFPTPTVGSISPSSGTSLGATSVTVTGTGFSANAAGTNGVTIGGAEAANVVVVNDTTITCETPAGTGGAVVDVVVTNDNGSGTGSSLFTYNATPTVTSVSPASGTSAGSTAVTLTGTGFVAAGAGTNTVTFDGVLATSVVVVNDTTITCETPAGPQGAAVDVVVSNDNGAGTLSDGFLYHPLPTISGVSPASGTSLGGTSITVTGSGFVDNGAGATTLTIGGLTPTNVVVVDDTTITCETLAGTPGAVVDLEVNNANGTGQLVAGFRYHVEPTLSAVAPTAGSSLGGTTVTLTGTGFQDDSPGVNAITFGGAAATSVVVVDDTTLTCETPVGTPGASVDVALTNANGSVTLGAAYDYHPTPTLTGLSPTAGTSLGGTSVTLTGTGFEDHDAGTNTVTFDGAGATSVVVVNDTTITCETPAGTSGASVDVLVSNVNGEVTLASAFTYHAAPTLGSVAPAAGTSLGGTSVTLTGTGFEDNDAGAATVTFAGVAATGVAVVSDTTITCDSPTGTPGASVEVRISNANGEAALPSAFTYHAEPTLAAVGPDHGAWQGGTAVTLTGTGFLDNAAGVNSVTFDGVAATNVVTVDDVTITCDTPAGDPGAAVDVVLSNANGSATLSDGYQYHSDVIVDVNADGIADLLVGAPGASGGDGEVSVFFGDDGGGWMDLSATGADLIVTPAVAGAALGSAVLAGDLNADGRADLVVGATGETAVYVFYGPLGTGTLSTSAADVVIDGVGASDDFGDALSIGDVNDDGDVDLAVGAPLQGASGEGASYVFLGGSGFAPTSASLADLEVAGVGAEALGSSLAIGDVNADDRADLLLGAPGTDRVHVFFGGSGISGGTTAAADATLDGESAGDGFGSSVVCSDVSGDGDTDLIVGAPRNDTAGTDSGAVYVFLGATGFTSVGAASAATIITGEAAGDELGTRVAAGDLDGDGTPEVLFSAPFWDVDGTTTGVGRTYAMLGGSLTATMAAGAADAIYTGESVTDERFGAGLGAGDLDDDGRADLSVGATENDAGGSSAGRVYVFLGSTTLLDTAATGDDITLTGAGDGDRFGASIAGTR